MSKRTPATFAKRQREQEQKQRTQERLRKREERKANPTAAGEEPIVRCMPFTDQP
jgi:hypothetical protein